MKRATFLSTLLATGTLGVASLTTMPAVAATGNDDWLGPKAYLGAGASFAKIDDAEVRDNDIGTGDLSDFDDDRTTWQAFGGIMVTSWLGLEAGYLELPDYNDNGFEIDGHGYTATALLAAPLTDRLEVYAKGGRVWWDAQADGPLGFDADIDGNDWLYGAGLNVGLVPNLSLRLEYTRYKLDGDHAEADLDLATAGLQLQF
ncbi:outer membrane beta-barrel protein [Immundisolibacter sp.]|uniref:outer membrane beta-barrel protein n=1 Tax=Immundisolibacter sp. TaxID=1934948 RepID=UPI003F841D92